MELLPFYGGNAVIEKKPWGQYYTYSRQGCKEKLLSATRITSKLGKGDVLLNWAVKLVGGYVMAKAEGAEADTRFTREEIILIAQEAMIQPEQAKIKGGQAGTLIHEYAHQFALACINDTDLPDYNALLANELEDVQLRAKNGISAFLDWYNGNDVEFLEMEKTVYFNSHLAGVPAEAEPLVEYMGITDLIAKVNGKRAIIDYKSSKGIYSEQEYQLEAYFLAENSNAEYEHRELLETSFIVDFHKETGELLVKEITPDEGLKNRRAFIGLHAVALREKEKGNK